MEVNTVFGVLGVTTILVFCLWRISNQLWFKPKNTEKRLRDQGLKGSPYKFLFGDWKEMEQMAREARSKPMDLTDDIGARVLPMFYKTVNTYGKNCFIWMGTNPVILLSNPTMIREVLANYQKFQKPNGPFWSILTKGLFVTEGDQWAKHRKIINPAFHVEKMKHMELPIYVSCSEMMEKWEELLAGEGSCEVDVWPFFYTFSGDVISRTAFGSSFEEGRKIFELQKEQVEFIAKMFWSVFIPGSRFLPTKNNRRMKEINKEVTSTIKSIIDKRMVTMESGETSNNDLLGILLDSNYNEIKYHGNKRFGLTIEQVIEECKVFYFAGHDTTANALVWTLILLSQHKNWQTQAREEVLHVLGDRKPDITSLNRLKIMNMILNEVQRLYPVSPVLSRSIHEEMKLGNLTLPAGSLIFLNTLFLHHDKDIWGEDAKMFNPQRFSEGVLKAMKPGEASYIPFGGGPRICIGQNFAMLEMKMALAMILPRFSFELSPSYSHAPLSLLTMQPQFGAHLILHKL